MNGDQPKPDAVPVADQPAPAGQGAATPAAKQRMVRFDFPPGATAAEIAEALAQLQREHGPKR
jgi:hypothetical protein